MIKLSYSQVMGIQESATKKLLDYIDRFLQRENGISTIDFCYPNFDKRRTRVAFNVWVSLDYKTKYGKNFIEHFLEEEPYRLDKYEKIILEERNKSHISIYEIKNIQGDLIHVEDLLLRKEHLVWEPELSKFIDKNELVFGRVANVIVGEKFVGDVNFLPNFLKDEFVGGVFVDFNKTRLNNLELSMEEYLREYSLHVYEIYTNCVYSIAEDSYENSEFEHELEEFADYLLNVECLSDSTLKKHMENLMYFYEYYLVDKGMTLYDIDEISIEDFIIDAINDNLISSQVELNSYIATFKKYIKFLQDDNPDYKESYDEILEISRNRFTYFDSKKIRMDIPLIYNESIVKILEDENISTFTFIKDYENFLYCMNNHKIELTSVNKFIKRKYINIINAKLINSIETNENANQIDVPLIHLFYKFSIDQNILRIYNNALVESDNMSEYFFLNQNQKIALFINYIWNIANWSELCKKNDMANLEFKNRLTLLSNLERLKENTWYNYSEIKMPSPNTNDTFELIPLTVTPVFDTVLYYFSCMNLVELKQNSKSIDEILITPLGKKVFKILKQNSNTKSPGDPNSGRVISLDEYRTNKDKA